MACQCRTLVRGLILVLVSLVYSNAELKWWQTTVIYQVYPRSFMDSDGDGVGDLKGIEMMADYFKELGVGAVWLNPIFKSPMEDFGYDISDYRDVDRTFGTVDDLKSLAAKLKSIGVKLILDFVPNHSSDKHEWFQKSVKKEAPYTDFYVWKDSKGNDSSGNPIPPNNWISVFNKNSAWTWNAQRQQFYLHEFLDKQPDLNYRNARVQQEMKDVISFWLKSGIDGFRIDAVPFLVEEASFPDEAYIDPQGGIDEYGNLNHTYTMDRPETFEVIRSWRQVLDEFAKTEKTDVKIMLTEAYTYIKTTMDYYGNDSYPISEMPFNFQLITNVSPQSNAHGLAAAINLWLDNMPKGKWANWVIGNHDQFRVATRYGVELTDALNMLVTLLPGTAVTYYGEELGMEDVFVRWDQAQDPQGTVLGEKLYLTATRDANRSPMQWNNSRNAGFSKNVQTWLPVNPNFWRLNVEKQRNAEVSHLKNYKLLLEARKTKTIQEGDTRVYTLGNWTLVFTRVLKDNPSFIVLINMATEEVQPDLSQLNIAGLPDKLHVYIASINSIYRRGDVVSTGKDALSLRPKAALVLTTEDVKKGSNSAGLSASASVVFAVLATSLLRFVS